PIKVNIAFDFKPFNLWFMELCPQHWIGAKKSMSRGPGDGLCPPPAPVRDLYLVFIRLPSPLLHDFSRNPRRRTPPRTRGPCGPPCRPLPTPPLLCPPPRPPPLLRIRKRGPGPCVSHGTVPLPCMFMILVSANICTTN